KAVFDQTQRTLVLTENPLLHEGPNEVAGDRVIVFLDENRSVVEGGRKRVKAVLYPTKDGTLATAKEPPRPEPAVGSPPRDASAARCELPAAGTVGLSQAHRRGEHPRDPRDARPERRRASRPLPAIARRARDRPTRKEQSVLPLRRRAASRRDHARAGHLAVV